MDCLKCNKCLSSYLDDEISSRQRSDVENHLRNCSTCRTKLESMRLNSEHLKELPRIEGDLSERNRLIASLHEKIALEPSTTSVRIHTPWKKYAFGSLFVIVILLVIGFMVKSPEQTQPPFEYNPGQPEEGYMSGPVDERLMDRMIQVMEFERIHAIQYEAFSEPVLGIYVSEPAPPVEGGNLHGESNSSVKNG